MKIVNIHEAGRWPTGEPFYAMKMVEGQSLARVIADTRTLSERLALLPRPVKIAFREAGVHAPQQEGGGFTAEPGDREAGAGPRRKR